MHICSLSLSPRTGFQAEFLETFISLPNNEFVLNEDLEQLKVIGAGLRIAIGKVWRFRGGGKGREEMDP